MASQKYVAKRHALVLQVKSLGAISICFRITRRSSHLINSMVLSGLLLSVEVLGAAWRVPGEHVQSRQSPTPAEPHTFGHPLLPEGTCTACTESGGMFDVRYMQHTHRYKV